MDALDTASVVAFFSLLIAAAALAFSIRTHWDGIKRNRRDLFLSLHERLSHPDQVRGRTLLREEISSAAEAEKIRKKRRADYELAMSAINMLDILGLYVDKKYVDKELVFDEWGWLYGRCFDHGKYVLKDVQWYDEEREIRAPWRHFAELGKEASRRYP
ncbi:hypothetical protein [Streptomyces sp. MK37H]|uniref:hypothetical protein n=1 Tax=Streptomyces sp. MK37H TaxID=2699117 RepID=UPI001B368290|nr:hypothetical protein [Streptomyces sp. MK37H]MBP8538573.1 hypothetical protein [Streptomyces sp. MK37H]